MKLLTLIFIFLLNLDSFANEVAKSVEPVKINSENISPAAVSLAECKPQKDPKTNTEETLVRAEAEKAALSREELLARLIYSESLSTGYWNDKCTAKSEDDIMTTIGWGIMNRVKQKSKTSLDAYSDVIFMKGQFRTSFSSKKINPFAQAFLCPLKSDAYLNQTTKKPTAMNLYKKSQEIANSIIVDYEQNGIKKEYNSITNFFYPYSEYFGEMRPKWATNKDPNKNKGYIKNLGFGVKPCVETYRIK